jgi:hypothetical protein
MLRRRIGLGVLLLVVIAVPLGTRLLVGGDGRGRLSEAAPRSVAALYHHHFRDLRHERMFLASVAFFLTFAAVRAITHAIRAGRGPFHDVVTSRGHVHHLVWGIGLLLVIGYLWLIQIGTGAGAGGSWSSGATALLFGAGSALTLDEFALWLTFRDVYWEREGRLSVDAVLLFGSLLSVGLWGGPFLRDLLLRWLRF